MREFHVLNFGAGVQPTVLFLLSREPDPKVRFDLAIFADTGEEPASVYRHLVYLQSLGDPLIRVRSAGKLGDDLVKGRNTTGQRFVSIPCFTADGAGKVGIVRRQCTADYKIEVVYRTIRREVLGLKPRQRMPKDTTIHQYFRISSDEAARAERAKKRFAGIKHTVLHWPLIEMGWSSKNCLAYLKDKLPHVVPRSSCTFCPYKTNQEWARLKATDTEGWNRAVGIDNALRDKNSVANGFFKAKKAEYRKCKHYLTSSLAGLTVVGKNSSTNRINEKLKAFDAWTAASIEQRQAMLI